VSGCFLIIIAGMYLYAAVEQYWKGNAGIALAFFGYALGNFGLLYQTSK